MNDGRFDDKEKIERRTSRSRRKIGSERPRVGRRVRRRTEKRNKASETCSGREIRTIENIGRRNTKNDTQEALQEDMEASGKIRAELQECVILIEDTLASGAETSDAPSTSNASIFESNTSTPQPTNVKARLRPNSR